jgi:hypothetical protein
MKFTTLIPTHLNNGKKVPARQLRSMLDGLVKQFGGCSNEGVTQGQWIDPSNAIRYRDQSLRISVVCDRVMLDEARASVIRIGAALRQRAMYFEVRDYDGVQILEIPFSEG